MSPDLCSNVGQRTACSFESRPNWMRCTSCLVCLSWGKILLYAHRRTREEFFFKRAIGQSANPAGPYHPRCVFVLLP